MSSALPALPGLLAKSPSLLLVRTVCLPQPQLGQSDFFFWRYDPRLADRFLEVDQDCLRRSSRLPPLLLEDAPGVSTLAHLQVPDEGGFEDPDQDCRDERSETSRRSDAQTGKDCGGQQGNLPGLSKVSLKGAIYWISDDITFPPVCLERQSCAHEQWWSPLASPPLPSSTTRWWSTWATWSATPSWTSFSSGWLRAPGTCWVNIGTLYRRADIVLSQGTVLANKVGRRWTHSTLLGINALLFGVVMVIVPYQVPAIRVTILRT